jgi:hypothetical protein
LIILTFIKGQAATATAAAVAVVVVVCSGVVATEFFKIRIFRLSSVVSFIVGSLRKSGRRRRSGGGRLQNKAKRNELKPGETRKGRKGGEANQKLFFSR